MVEVGHVLSVIVSVVIIAIQVHLYTSRKDKRSIKCTVKSIYFYPIKSCRGIELKKAKIGTYGIENDRKWMIISSSNNNFITQRQIPAMSLICPSLSTSGTLSVDFPGMETLKISPSNTIMKKEYEVRVWNSICKGIDEGDECASWFQRALKNDSLRLVRMTETHDREVPDKYKQESLSNLVSFTDGFPLLIISEGSLKELNSRISSDGPPLLINRFRPNIVVSGGFPFIEDTWKRIQIGEIIIRCVKKCSRCKITTVDQTTGESPSNEPLDTLATFRKGLLQKGGNDVCFGQNAIHENIGEIENGEIIQVLE